MNSWTVLFPLAVLLYYFFRKRYQTKKISSTLFWEQSMRETKVSPFLKNLQQNALFYLQMAALLLLVFVLLGPFLKSEQSVGEQTVLVVDTSASMLAGEGKTSLLEASKQEMLQLVDANKGKPFTIITTGKEPALALRNETDPEAIKNAIQNVSISYEHEQMGSSLEFMRSVIADQSATVHIFTDYLDRSVFSDGSESIRYFVHTNESQLSNVSIDKFGAVKTAAGTEAIVKLVNQTETDVNGSVQITDALEGTQLAEKPFAIKSGEETLVSFKDLPSQTAMQAALMVEDQYEVDNEAFILLGNDISDAMVDSQLHELIRKAFQAIGMEVASGSVNEMKQRQHSSTIIVTNDTSFLQRGTQPIVLIGRNDANAHQVEDIVTASQDMLFAVAPIEDVYVSSLYPPFDAMETIAFIGNEPFIQRSPRGDIVVLADIEMTDWPLHPSFPLFFWSATESVRSGSEVGGTFTPSQRKAVLSHVDTKGIEVFNLHDEYKTSFANGTEFVAPEQPGIYKLMDNKRETLIAVQLEQEEKKLSYGTPYQIGMESKENEKEIGKKSIGWLFLLPVLLLLVIEWEVQRRRGYPN
ncbi:BatA and WFA domain-containing protein [Sporosarcina sp. Te-1]|uniref:vWA domain-containing protein n=1 Tax=Sporosarcina sp. Te-1 TaxID=2818390 RepID=UPI001A9DF626|nr:BatA and WFA domain-containing protein [Sporosarcina sp. Te-1]QTD42475.1 BatA and WFA domain-containing protein [Sporosarcina sp. Te-1]